MQKWRTWWIKGHFWPSFTHTGQGSDCLGFLDLYGPKITPKRKVAAKDYYIFQSNSRCCDQFLLGYQKFFINMLTTTSMSKVNRNVDLSRWKKDSRGEYEYYEEDCKASKKTSKLKINLDIIFFTFIWKTSILGNVSRIIVLLRRMLSKKK